MNQHKTVPWPSSLLSFVLGRSTYASLILIICNNAEQELFLEILTFPREISSRIFF